MGSKSKNQTSNYTENTSTQLGNYGDGFQVVLDGQDNNITVDNSDAEVAITAIEEAGIMAETAFNASEKMHAVNTQFADNVVNDTFEFTRQSNRDTLQFADNAIADAFQVSAANSRLSAQIADNSMQSNDNMLTRSIAFIGQSLEEAQQTIGDVVSQSQASNSQLAKSVMSVGSEVKTGTSTNQKLVMNVVTVGAVGGLIMVLVKAIK